jgi:hypothetical protein
MVAKALIVHTPARERGKVGEDTKRPLTATTPTPWGGQDSGIASSRPDEADLCRPSSLLNVVPDSRSRRRDCTAADFPATNCGRAIVRGFIGWGFHRHLPKFRAQPCLPAHPRPKRHAYSAWASAQDPTNNSASDSAENLSDNPARNGARTREDAEKMPDARATRSRRSEKRNDDGHDGAGPSKDVEGHAPSRPIVQHPSKGP